jgi:ABC-2 type transport system ATP-binding protein
MDEAAELADRVGIMDHGRLLALDTPEELMRSLAEETTLELTTDGAVDGDALAALATLAGVERVERLQAGADGSGPQGDEAAADEPGFRVRLYLASEGAQLVAPAASLLAEHGLALSAVKLGSPTLEDVFIHLTGRTLR